MQSLTTFCCVVSLTADAPAGPENKRSSNDLRDITRGNWTTADISSDTIAGNPNPYFVSSIHQVTASSILAAASIPGNISHMEDFLDVGDPRVTEQQIEDMLDQGWYVPGVARRLLAI